MPMPLNTAIFFFKQLSTYVNRVQYTVVKAILFKPSSSKGVLCIKYIKFRTSRVIGRVFGATK